MEDVDRTFELLDVLDFHIKHGKVDLSKQDKAALASLVLQKIDQNPKLLFNETNTTFIYKHLFGDNDSYSCKLIKSLHDHFTEAQSTYKTLQHLD
jgi:hypothetical protein